MTEGFPSFSVLFWRNYFVAVDSVGTSKGRIGFAVGRNSRFIDSKSIDSRIAASREILKKKETQSEREREKEKKPEKREKGERGREGVE